MENEGVRAPRGENLMVPAPNEQKVVFCGVGCGAGQGGGGRNGGGGGGGSFSTGFVLGFGFGVVAAISAMMYLRPVSVSIKIPFLNW